jgi:hypothetical protein
MTDTNNLLNFRLVGINEGAPRIPAHITIHENIADTLVRELTYVHYMWSGVSCVRPKVGRLLEFKEALSGGQNLSGREVLQRFEHLIAESMTSLGIEILWDSSRNNGGYPGFYVYLGTSEAGLMVSRSTRARIENACD